MNLTPIEKYTVKAELKMVNASMFLNYFSTVWKGRPLIACFNNLSNSIVSVNCYEQLSPSDFKWLEDVIVWYIHDYEEVAEEQN
jgi:hypothetical protein